MKNILVVGSLNMDFVVTMEEMPEKGETIQGKQLEYVCGGKGANQACACGRLSGKVAMLGAVGMDANGEALLSSLAVSGVDVSHIKKMPDVGTGVAVINVDSHGENSIVIIKGANEHVDSQYIDENIQMIAESDLILLQLEIPMETVIYVAKKAKELNKMVILDPAPMPDCLPEELLCNVDLIKPNEIELAQILHKEITEDNLANAAEELHAKGVNQVIITLGKGGSYIKSKDTDGVRIKPAKSVIAVDTTAAGDSFIGAVATMLAEDKSLVEAGEYATKVSSIVISKVGAQSSIPTREEVNHIYC